MPDLPEMMHLVIFGHKTITTVVVEPLSASDVGLPFEVRIKDVFFSHWSSFIGDSQKSQSVYRT